MPEFAKVLKFNPYHSKANGQFISGKGGGGGGAEPGARNRIKEVNLVPKHIPRHEGEKVEAYNKRVRDENLKNTGIHMTRIPGESLRSFNARVANINDLNSHPTGVPDKDKGEYGFFSKWADKPANFKPMLHTRGVDDVNLIPKNIPRFRGESMGAYNQRVKDTHAKNTGIRMTRVPGESSQSFDSRVASTNEQVVADRRFKAKLTPNAKPGEAKPTPIPNASGKPKLTNYDSARRRRY